MGTPEIGSGLRESFAEGREGFRVTRLDRVEATGGLGSIDWGAVGGLVGRLVGWFGHGA